MKANELRIGNYVYDEDVKYKTSLGHTVILSKGVHSFNLGEINLKPIPLTEEWLLKFGFESWNCKGVDWIFEKVIYKELDIEQKMIISSSGTCCIEEQEDHPEVEVQKFIIRPDIHYVHQLQNLYFALTGQELEFAKVR
jgi:hypothetical protein